MAGFRMESLMHKPTVTIKVPLSSSLMSSAGVPFADALWYARLPQGRAKVRALVATQRGQGIVQQVRKFCAGQGLSQIVPAPS